MSRRSSMLVAGVLTLFLVGVTTWAATTVDFGRIAAVNLVTRHSSGAQTGGVILGGLLGAAAASNRAVGTVGGMVAGQQIGRMSSRRQAFEYTVRVAGRPNVRIVTDEAGLRVGDCVAVERGNFNNLRLVNEDRCAPNVTPAESAVREADACIMAKEHLLAVTTDEEFDRAERKVRLLCVD